MLPRPPLGSPPGECRPQAQLLLCLGKGTRAWPIAPSLGSQVSLQTPPMTVRRGPPPNSSRAWRMGGTRRRILQSKREGARACTARPAMIPRGGGCGGRGGSSEFLWEARPGLQGTAGSVTYAKSLGWREKGQYAPPLRMARGKRLAWSGSQRARDRRQPGGVRPRSERSGAGVSVASGKPAPSLSL